MDRDLGTVVYVAVVFGLDKTAPFLFCDVLSDHPSCRRGSTVPCLLPKTNVSPRGELLIMMMYFYPVLSQSTPTADAPPTAAKAHTLKLSTLNIRSRLFRRFCVSLGATTHSAERLIHRPPSIINCFGRRRRVLGENPPPLPLETASSGAAAFLQHPWL